MLIDGKRVNLSPGMNITAEIKTGQLPRGIAAMANALADLGHSSNAAVCGRNSRGNAIHC